MSPKNFGKRLIAGFILSVLLLMAAFLIFLTYAIGPGVDPSRFPPQGIVTFPQTGGPPPSPSDTLTVVTYNIGYASGDKNNQGDVLSPAEVEKNLAEMVQVLKPLHPDLLMLQEVDFASHRSLEINQMERLAQGLGLPYGAYAMTWNKKYVAWPYWPFNRHFGKLVSGQAVLSRYPLTHQNIEVFSRPEDNPFWYNWFYLDRVIQSLTVQVGPAPIQIINTHLEAFSEKNKGRQIARLGEFIQQLPTGPKIVAGDFNLIWSGTGDLEEDPAVHHALLEKFIETTGLQLAGGDRPELSFPSWRPHKQIDLIFYSPSFRLEEKHTLGQVPASDHLPVWVRLKIPR
jgi:endonuclease/exonuclease/phosphatase family metal-dependent hydrolase